MSYNQRNDEIHDNIERIIWATSSPRFCSQPLLRVIENRQPRARKRVTLRACRKRHAVRR